MNAPKIPRKMHVKAEKKWYFVSKIVQTYYEKTFGILDGKQVSLGQFIRIVKGHYNFFKLFLGSFSDLIHLNTQNSHLKKYFCDLETYRIN